MMNSEASDFWNRFWRCPGLNPGRTLLALFGLCVAAYLVTIPMPRVDGQLTGSDGAHYFAYLPSLLIDHDLDFSNQYATLLPPGASAGLPRTPDGRPHNKWAIGSAILWAPFFLVGHLLGLGLRALGYFIPLDGMGFLYQIPTLLGSIAYGFAGLLLVYRCCLRFFSVPASFWAVALIWFATNLIYYMIAEPSMSHACSFFAVALFLYLWLSFRPAPTLRQWLFLGLSGGLIALIRQPDATWLLLPLLDLLLQSSEKWRKSLPKQVAGLLVFGMAAAIAFIPQMLIWIAMNGSALRNGYTYAGEQFHWLSPHVPEVLFSSNHGLFLWHPILLPAIAGLIYLYKKNRAIAGLLACVIALQLYVVSSWETWWGGDAFGARFLISSLPAFALGLAATLERAAERRIFTAMGLSILALIFWNGLFLLQYRFGYIPKEGSLTFHQLTLGKFEILADLASRLPAMWK